VPAGLAISFWYLPSPYGAHHLGYGVPSGDEGKEYGSEDPPVHGRQKSTGLKTRQYKAKNTGLKTRQYKAKNTGLKTRQYKAKNTGLKTRHYNGQ
jgi:hypothetical protein